MTESMSLRKRNTVRKFGQRIGRGIAKTLSECGAEVLALSRTQSDLDSLRAEASNIQPVCVELADWDATRKAVEELGPIHLLVNNASMFHMKPFNEIVKEELKSLFAVNLNAIVNVSQVVTRGMTKRGEGGSIVIISSIASVLGTPHAGTYSATKGAQNSLMRVMANELGPHKIRVNSILPTLVETPMVLSIMATFEQSVLDRQYLGRIPVIKDIVDGTLFLLSDQSAMITGVCLPIDCGYTVA